MRRAAAIVGRSAAVFRLLAALFAALVGLRFFGGAVSRTLEQKRQSGFVPTPSLSSGGPGRKRDVLAEVERLIGETAGTSNGGSAQEGDAGRDGPVRATLIVTVGPARSEVLVNGVSVGESPYVGDLVCQPGEHVGIDLIPPEGMPQRYRRLCVPGTLRVR